MAPEIVKPGLPKQVFGRQVDVWACGITLFNLLTAKFPFSGVSLPELQQQLLNAQPELTLVKNQHVRELLSQMLEKNPHERIKTTEILKHPWLKQVLNNDSTGSEGKNIIEFMA